MSQFTEHKGPDQNTLPNYHSDVPFDVGVHIKTSAPKEEQRHKLKELRDLLDNTGNDPYHDHRKWCSDDQLLRFLVARNFNVRHTYEMLMTALKWRSLRRPDMIEKSDGWAAKLSKEAETGKIYVAGHDRWSRPVVVFDNSVQNTHNWEDHMTFLAWSLELAIREMPPYVDKYVVFMHLEHFSFWNNPSYSSTTETIHMLCDCFPERLGHCICLQPPGIFLPVFGAVKGFIDPKTVSKVKFIYGDISDGSDNDREMRKILGDNWKVLTGAGQPVYKPKCSPGFRHEVYWPEAMDKVQILQAKELAADRALTFAPALCEDLKDADSAGKTKSA